MQRESVTHRPQEKGLVTPQGPEGAVRGREAVDRNLHCAPHGKEQGGRVGRLGVADLKGSCGCRGTGAWGLSQVGRSGLAVIRAGGWCPECESPAEEVGWALGWLVGLYVEGSLIGGSFTLSRNWLLLTGATSQGQTVRS